MAVEKRRGLFDADPGSPPLHPPRYRPVATAWSGCQEVGRRRQAARRRNTTAGRPRRRSACPARRGARSIAGSVPGCWQNSAQSSASQSGSSRLLPGKSNRPRLSSSESSAQPNSVTAAIRRHSCHPWLSHSRWASRQLAATSSSQGCCAPNTQANQPSWNSAALIRLRCRLPIQAPKLPSSGAGRAWGLASSSCAVPMVRSRKPPSQ